MKIHRIVLLIGFFILISASSYAADWEVFSKISYLDWVEKTNLSKRDPFLRESGLVYSVGGSVLFRPTEKFFSKSELEFFGGSIDYQGENLTNMTPHNTSSARLGATLEETLGYKIKISSDFTLSPFATLGVSAWWRGVSAEAWYVGYGKLGVQVDKGMFFAKAGLLLPFYTEAHGRYAGVFWINGGKETSFEVQPQGVLTPFAEIGIRYKRAAVSLSYELRKWKDSDRVNLGGGVHVFQPETTQSLVSLKIGFSF